MLELDAALAPWGNNGYQYFNGWTDSDFNNAVEWGKACTNHGYVDIIRGREAYLRGFQNQMHEQALDSELRKKQRADAAVQAEQVAKAKQEQQQEQQVKEQQDRNNARLIAQCESTKKYQQFNGIM